MAARNLNSRKRKGCQDIVFEIDEDDVSPANSPRSEDMVNAEPSLKIQKVKDELDSNPISGQSICQQHQENTGNVETTDENPKQLEIVYETSIKSEHLDVQISGSNTNIDMCQSSTLTKESGARTSIDCQENSQVVSGSLDSGVDFTFEESQELDTSQNILNATSVLESSAWVVQDETLCEDVEMSSLQSLDTQKSTQSKSEQYKQVEKLENEIIKLRHNNSLMQKEVLDLREKLNNCTCTRIEAEGKPLINIQILDSDIKKKYKKQIAKYFMTFPKFYVKTTGESYTVSIYEKREKQSTPSENGSEEVSSKNDVVEVSNVLESPRKLKKKKKKKKHSDEVDSLFVIDTAPSLVTSHHEQNVRYSSKFTINENENEKAEERNCRPPPQNKCFNCDESHNLRDCPLPKDFRKINQARMKMKEKGNKSVRYHLEEDQKFAHLKPGEISDSLRDALGIEKQELPPYIYRMRVLGYPPGWIKDVHETNSTLSLFDSEGFEDGKSEKGAVQADNIISYPGFNIPLPKNVKDNYRMYGCPPFNRRDCIENMVEHLNETNVKLENDNLVVCDMDVSVDDAASKETINSAHIPQPTDSGENSQESEMSLTDLERQKLELLAELNDSKSQTNDENKKSKNSDNVVQLNDSDSNNHSIDTEKLVKDSSFGTPILKSASKFSRLPHADNFAQNVSPVINFENLPNSTGKYEQMTGVLAKVRKMMKTLNDK